MTKFITILAMAFALSACAQKNLPPMMFMPRTVDSPAQPVTNWALGNVTVTADKEGVEQHITPDNFQIALIETIKRANLFGDDRTKAVKIDARIFKASFPIAGFEMTSDLNVHYTVTSAENKVLLDDDVIYQGMATGGEEFVGMARALLAFQRANEGHFNILLPKLRRALTQ